MNKTINKNLIFGLAIFALTVLVLPLQTKAYNNAPEWQDTEMDVAEYVDLDEPDYGYDYDNNDNNSDNYSTAKPSISGINPASANKNSGFVTVTITGSNFNPTSTTQFDDSNRSTTYINSNKITVLLTSRDLSTNGVYPIDVYNSNSRKSSNEAYFTVKNAVVTSTAISGVSGASGASASSGSNKSTVKKTTTATTTSKNSTVKESDSKNSGSELAGSAIFGANGFLPSNILQWIIFAILILLAVILWRKLWVTDEDKRAPLKHA